MSKKILHIVRQFWPMIGGLEDYVHNLAREQLILGYDVTILTLNRNYISNKQLPLTDITPDGIRVIRVPFTFSRKYPLAFKSFGYFKHYDILHVHAVDFFCDFVALTKWIHRKKIILTTHGGFFHTSYASRFKKIFFNVITRFTIKAYDIVIGCSENDVKVFRPIYKTIIRIDNGVNVQQFLNIPKNAQEGNLLYLGRIDSHKRVDSLIHLLANLKRKSFDYNLTVVGPDSRGLLPELKRLADSLGVSEQVSFKGALSREELLQEFSRAYVFVTASEYEGFGLSVVEALASGTPCFISDIESFRSISTLNEACLVNDFNDSKSTVTNFERFIIKISADYQNISNNARIFSQTYDWKQVVHSVIRYY